MLILKKFIGLEGAAGIGVIRMGDIRTGSYNTLLGKGELDGTLTKYL